MLSKRLSQLETLKTKRHPSSIIKSQFVVALTSGWIVITVSPQLLIFCPCQAHFMKAVLLFWTLSCKRWGLNAKSGVRMQKVGPRLEFNSSARGRFTETTNVLPSFVTLSLIKMNVDTNQPNGQKILD